MGLEDRRLDLNPTANNMVAINGSTAQTYTLPTPGGYYYLTAKGNSCTVREVDTAVDDAKGMFIPSGETIGPHRLNGGTLSVIGSSTAGYLYVVELKTR